MNRPSAEEENVNICVSVSLTSWLSRTVHCDFNSSLVRGHLRRIGEHSDGQSEALPYERKGEEDRWGEDERKKIKKKTGGKKKKCSLVFSNTLLSMSPRLLSSHLPEYPLGLLNALSHVSHGPPDKNKPDATHTQKKTQHHAC